MHLPNLKQKYIKLLQPKMFIKANSNAKVEETDILGWPIVPKVLISISTVIFPISYAPRVSPSEKV